MRACSKILRRALRKAESRKRYLAKTRLSSLLENSAESVNHSSPTEEVEETSTEIYSATEEVEETSTEIYSETNHTPVQIETDDQASSNWGIWCLFLVIVIINFM